MLRPRFAKLALQVPLVSRRQQLSAGKVDCENEEEHDAEIVNVELASGEEKANGRGRGGGGKGRGRGEGSRGRGGRGRGRSGGGRGGDNSDGGDKLADVVDLVEDKAAPSGKAKAKAKPKAVPDKQPAKRASKSPNPTKAEQTPQKLEGGEAGPPPKRTRTRSASGPATFARRFCPKGESMKARWSAIKDAFEIHLKPRLQAPSQRQDTAYNSCPHKPATHPE